MSKPVSAISYLLSGVLACVPLVALAQESKKVELKSGESSITWIGRKVTGSHTGSVALKSGEVQLDGANIKSGRFEIDLAQVQVKDIEDPKYNAKLVGHLKSPDFFAVDKFPLAEFIISSTTPLAAPLPTGENVTINGSLKIKGLSQDVQFPAQVTVKDGMAEAKGKVTLDRTKWEIRYGSGKFFQGLGDKLIKDEFEVNFSVKGDVVG